MDNIYDKNNENTDKNNENKEKKEISTPESLLSFMIMTCFSRIGTDKIQEIKEEMKKMIATNRANNPGQDEKYDNLEHIVDDFFSYISDPRLIQQITRGEISRSELEEKTLSDIVDIPKRKYDMRDLYDSSLIANSLLKEDGKKVVITHEKKQTFEYFDKDGGIVIISEVGEIAYQEWEGLTSSLPVYQVQKYKPNGDVLKHFVCSRINFSQMDEPKYRDAVLGELLSDENINKSNVGSYIGQVVKRKMKDKDDIPHKESQNANEYSYRIDDEYVLVYDASEVSAVLEAIKKHKMKSVGEKPGIDDSFDDLSNR